MRWLISLNKKQASTFSKIYGFKIIFINSEQYYMKRIEISKIE